MALDDVGELRRVNDAARTVLTAAREAGDGGLTLQATDRILRQVETQAKLIGLINDGNVVQVSFGADWPSLRALVPFPEARLAVLEALEGAS